MRRVGFTLRLVRLYPPGWRARYGEEFEQLLLDELTEERPRARWWLNLLGHAVLARLVEFGIAENGEGRRRIDAAVRLAAGIPVRTASGASDPFHAGVLGLAPHLPASASLHISPGCHNTSFFSEQQLPSLRFLGRHLSA